MMYEVVRYLVEYWYIIFSDLEVYIYFLFSLLLQVLHAEWGLYSDVAARSLQDQLYRLPGQDQRGAEYAGEEVAPQSAAGEK